MPSERCAFARLRGCATTDVELIDASDFGERGGIFSAYHESWRKHPMLNPRYRDMFPGFGYAVIIFGTYLVGEFAYNRFISKPSGGHGHQPGRICFRHEDDDCKQPEGWYHQDPKR